MLLNSWRVRVWQGSVLDYVVSTFYLRSDCFCLLYCHRFLHSILTSKMAFYSLALRE